jgi:IclR family pca regulon transcriptional regulator
MKTAAIVQSLDRGLELLEAVAAHPPGLSLAEIAEFLEVSQPSAFNLAATLVNRGYLEKTAKPVRYRLGRAVMALTRSYLASTGGGPEREEVLRELARTLNLGKGGLVICELMAGSFIFTLRAGHPGELPLQRTMQRLPAPYHMATPLCLMAFLDPDTRLLVEEVYPFHELGRGFWSGEAELRAYLAQVRREGYVHLERDGPFRVAAPIFDAAGNIAAGLGLSRPRHEELGAAERRGLLEAVREAARRLSRNT